MLTALLAAELYLRRTVPQVVHEAAWLARRPAAVESDSGLLVRDTRRGKRLVPNARVLVRNQHWSHRDVLLRTNSLGLRDEELPADKKPGEIRILVLGDSITLGDSMPAEEVFLKRAQALLAGRGGEVRLINAGISDAGLQEEIDILEETVDAVRPDAVLVAFYLNDSRPPWGFPSELGAPGWLRRRSVLADQLWRRAAFARWLGAQGKDRFEWIHWDGRLDWRRDREDFRQLAALARYDWGAAWQGESWDAVERGLDRLERLSKQHGFRLAFAAFPVYFQVYAEFLEDEPQRELGRRLAKRGIPYLDLLPLFRRHRAARLFFDHCHPLPAANDLIGRELAAFLKSELLKRA